MEIFYPAFLESEQTIMLPWGCNDSLESIEVMESYKGQALSFSVRYRQRNIGLANIHNINKNTSCLGCWLNKDHQSQGIGSEVLSELHRFCIEELKNQFTFIETEKNNQKAIAMAKKLRYKEFGTKGNVICFKK